MERFAVLTELAYQNIWSAIDNKIVTTLAMKMKINVNFLHQTVLVVYLLLNQANITLFQHVLTVVQQVWYQNSQDWISLVTKKIHSKAQASFIAKIVIGYLRYHSALLLKVSIKNNAKYFYTNCNLFPLHLGLITDSKMNYLSEQNVNIIKTVMINGSLIHYRWDNYLLSNWSTRC